MEHSSGNESRSHEQDTGGEVLVYIIIEIVISFFAFFNNTLILIAIYKFKNLRTKTYTLIGSLASADIAVALISNPSGIVLRKGLKISSDYVSSNLTSGLTQCGCSFFVLSVLIFTQVSIFNLLAIAVDRFIAIYYSLRYKAIMTTLRLRIIIAITWILGATIGSIPHIIWYEESYPTNNQELVCEFEKQVSSQYMVYLNFFTFTLLPLAVMFVLYYFIFKSAKRQLRKIYSDVWFLNEKTKLSLTSLKDFFKIKKQSQAQRKKELLSQQNCAKLLVSKENSASLHIENSFKDSPRPNYSKSESSLNLMTAKQSKLNSTNTLKSSSLSLNSIKNDHVKSNDIADGSMGKNALSISMNTISSATTVSLDGNDSLVNRQNKLKRRSKYLKKEFRAARSLFMVIGVFAICWLPLHIYNTYHLFSGKVVDVWFVDFAILLSHANSLMNPIIYAFHLSDMRAAFRKLFSSFYDYLKYKLCCFIYKKKKNYPLFKTKLQQA